MERGEPEQLIACWTLDEADWQLLANKTAATRLGFALMLKFFDLEGRFPTSTGELPPAAVDYVARLVNVPAGELGSYGWSGRTIEYHRAQIRSERGFGEATVDDEQQLAGWLARELCPVELDDTRLREDLLARCREQRMEPPARSRLERILNSGRAQFERQFTTGTVARLPAAAIDRLEQLAARDEEATASAGVLAELKSDPGRSSLNTVLEEIDKLERVLALGLPPGLFADCSEKLIAAWRARAAAAYPSDLRAMPQPIRLTLLAVLCWSRTAEITDSLVDLLIEVVHKIRARAENRVEKELVRDLKRVRGKQGLLFALAEAAVEHPDDTVRSALFPVVSETTLRQLVKEAKASEQIFQQQVRKVIRGSYSNHYRRMLPRLLQTLEFRCSNSAYRPVMDALELLGRHVDTPGQQRFYAPGEHVPLDSVVPDEWRQAVVDEHGKVERIPCCARSATPCGDARSTSPARNAGATPTRTCPATSMRTATCTTRRSASRATQRRSSPISSDACMPASSASTTRSARAPPAGCGSRRDTASRGSSSRRSDGCPNHQTSRRCTARSRRGTARSTCSTSSRTPTTSPGSPCS